MVEGLKSARHRTTHKGAPTTQQQFITKFGKPITEYASIKKAVELLKPITENNYYWHLPRYFLFIGQDPDAVIAQRKADLFSDNGDNEERYDKLTKLYIKHLVENKNYTGRGAAGIAGLIQGFFKNNSKRLSLNLGYMRLPRARRNRKFSIMNKEARMLFERADSSRDKLIIALMHQHGFAPKDVATFNLGDYPIEQWTHFERSRSKTGITVQCVSMPDVCDCLRDYLKVRGGTAGKLFVGREGPLTNKSITQIVSRLISQVDELKNVKGIKPSNLRDGFKDTLVSLKVDIELRKAFMGHVGDIEGEYGGYTQLVEALTEAAKTIAPALSLLDINRTGILTGLTEEEWNLLRDMLRYYKNRGREELQRDAHIL